MTKAKLSLTIAVAAAIATAAGASTAPAQVPSAVCAGDVCVTGVKENYDNAIATIGSTDEAAKDAVTGQTRPLADQVFTPLENQGPVCTPAVPSTTPICVNGAGTAVRNAEATACEEIPGALLWDYLTNRCGLVP